MDWAPVIVSFVFGGGVASWLSLRENHRRSLREALFKCFESYLKVMEYKAKALDTKSPEDVAHYYRALFDLQWTEYQMWKRTVVPDGPYREWLGMRRRQYETEAGYKEVWERLVNDQYYNLGDPFVKHLDRAHKGDIDRAMRDRELSASEYA